MSIYTDGSHLSSQPSSQLIEEFAGQVQKFFAETSQFRSLVAVRQLVKTNSVIQRRLGKGVLQKLTAGVEPPATPVTHGRVSLVVDTVIFARESVDLLSTFQEDIDTRMELAEQQGLLHGEHFDQSFLVQIIKGSQLSAPAGLNNAIGGGHRVDLASVGDDLDPDKLYAAISNLVIKFKNAKVPVKDLVLFVSPTHYNVLLNNNKLVDKDFSSNNGDFATYKLKSCCDCRIIETTLIPTAAGDSLLSNADNGSAYNVTATDAKAVVVALHPRGLLAAESIPLTSDIFFDKGDKCYYIDSWQAYGVTINRQDATGSVFKA